MRHLTLSIPDKDYSFFIKLIKKLDFVSIKETSKSEDVKQEYLKELKEAVEEINLIKAGKLKGRPLQELLDEL